MLLQQGRHIFQLIHKKESDMLDTILTIIQLAPWVISGASLICALTPTPKDDQIIGKIYKLIDWCAINVGRAKEK